MYQQNPYQQQPQMPNMGGLLGLGGANVNNMNVNFNFPQQQQHAGSQQAAAMAQLMGYNQPQQQQQLLPGPTPAQLGYHDTSEVMPGEEIQAVTEILPETPSAMDRRMSFGKYSYINDDYKLVFNGELVDIKPKGRAIPITDEYYVHDQDNDMVTGDIHSDTVAKLTIRKDHCPVVELLDANDTDGRGATYALYHAGLIASKYKYDKIFVINVIGGSVAAGEPLFSKVRPDVAVSSMSVMEVSLR
jgi:hypothetical protein